MQEMKEKIANEVELLKENKDLLKELWQKYEEGCESVFKEMDDISKETEISRVHQKYKYYVVRIYMYILPSTR